MKARADMPLDDLAALTQAARRRRDEAYGELITYSRKVFIPLTTLCRDVCHYCTFAKAPREIPTPYLTFEAVREIARAGAVAGCKEALFTLGDKPELRYRAAREALAAAGCATTADYLERAAKAVFDSTGLLPHLNPGILSRDELIRLREVSASMGIMLESTAQRLCERGGPHFGSPDKDPQVRLRMIKEAGELGIPFTTGLLIGIGETREERLEAIAMIADLHARYGHIQEVIIQNFRAKPGTRMAAAPSPDLEELVWTIAAARLMLPDDISIQAPPNLSPGNLGALVDAGINDWGGVSPVTPDHVNPEAAWPELTALARDTAAAGKQLTERLTVYPRFARSPDRWCAPEVARRLRELSDASGLARDDADWRAGTSKVPPAPVLMRTHIGSALNPVLRKAEAQEPLDQRDIVTLFEARGGAEQDICDVANAMRIKQSGDAISYVVTRNINYTNICAYACTFCAFSKGRGADSLRGSPYDLDLGEVARRVAEAHQRGAVEVCMQGGIHPHYTGETYLALLRTAKQAAPGMHVHAFSPLEVTHGAQSLGLTLDRFLGRLRDAGLGSLPGTAAEVLDEEVRAIFCPDKVSTSEWLEVMETAHALGLRTTATIMFGHVDRYDHWANHLIALRDLQRRSGGFTELVPLAFVANQAPIYRAGKARPGPTWREALLMHAVARLSLGPWIPNIQASWVKLGMAGAQSCLAAGANDLGGTLMNESITRAAGAAHGEEMGPQEMEQAIRALGRTPRQRTTLYADAPPSQQMRAFAAAPLHAVVNTPPKRNVKACR
ncbi:MAG: 5-amino-6-(D-ribitylamino)uracil--L-tyrosine 4-hydroxyphenyl transferase CofH [Erythrobacter sp.]